MKTILSISILAVIVAVTVFTIRDHNQTGRNHAATAALVSQSAELRTRIALAEEAVRLADGACAALEKEIAATQATRNAAEVAASYASNNPTITRRLTGVTIIANDQKRMAEFTADVREALDHIWGGMFKTVGLPPGQIEKFKEAIVWRSQRQIDVAAAAESQGLDPNSDTYRKLLRQEDDVILKKQAEAIGDSYEPYMEWARTHAVREHALRLASSEVYGEAPLSSAEVERVTRILADNSQRNPSERYGPELGHYVTPLTVNWETATPQLQAVLSPAQITTLQQFYRQKELAQEVKQQVARVTAQFNAKSPIP